MKEIIGEEEQLKLAGILQEKEEGNITLKQTFEQIKELAETLVSPPSVHFTSKTNEWETPSELFNKLNKEFNFTLDPCCTKENAKCERYYTIAEDGLNQSWKFERVFMNPPYGNDIGKWIRKAYMEGTTKGRADIVVCLIPARTDTKYWHEYIFDKASEIRFLKGRVKFVGGKFTAPFPSAIVVYKYQELSE